MTYVSDMTQNTNTIRTHINRGITAIGIAAAFAGSAWFGTAIASAQPLEPDTMTMTVDGTDYPVCVEEDCSDQPGQVGVWFSHSTGHWLLELGEGRTYVVTN